MWRLGWIREEFFPFRVDRFQKGIGVYEGKPEVTEVISPLYKMTDNLPNISSLFNSLGALFFVCLFFFYYFHKLSFGKTFICKV